MKILSKKLLLLGFSCVLLIGVTVYLTTAWYTRMVSSAGMEFEVAQWEFTANQMIDDFSVNIYQYSHVLQDSDGNTMVAAPGTAGYIPITLSLGDSEVDIDYYITVDVTTMSDEFQDRIFFYYEDEAGDLVLFKGVGDDLTGTITIDQETPEVVNVYWEWVYEVEPTEDDIEAYMTAASSSDEGADEGADEGVDEGVDEGADEDGGEVETEDTPVDTSSNAYLLAKQALIDEANEFDTLVGKNPDDYESDMIATLQIYGLQAEPESDDGDNVFVG